VEQEYIAAGWTSTRSALQQQARREGKSVSQFIRELLERYFSGSPDGIRH
jgi:hypothetical protein